MAVKGKGGPVTFRRDAAGLFLPTSFSIWVRPENNIPVVVHSYNGTNGSYVNIGHDGTNWYLSMRDVSTSLPIQYFAPVTLNKWAVIVFSRVSGPTFQLYYGLEDTSLPNVPVEITEIYSGSLPFFTFSHGIITCTSALSICNYKLWQYQGAPTVALIKDYVNKWDFVSFVTFFSVWLSTFRTPGDISNSLLTSGTIVRTWESTNAFTSIDPPNSLDFFSPDPAYLAQQTCPTWIYPRDGEVPFVFIDPGGTTPPVQTIVKGTQFWFFKDKGSIPPTGVITSAYYYGVDVLNPVGGPLRPGGTFNYGLWRNELGVEVLPTPSGSLPGATWTAGQDVPIPTSLTAAQIYNWQFGGMFTYSSQTPPSPPVARLQGRTEFLKALISYIGYPTGKPVIIGGDLSGLFVINKGSLVDKYNGTTELKIPDPTIRTAYIGE